jgi:hypothetical protein
LEHVGHQWDDPVATVSPSEAFSGTGGSLPVQVDDHRDVVAPSGGHPVLVAPDLDTVDRSHPGGGDENIVNMKRLVLFEPVVVRGSACRAERLFGEGVVDANYFRLKKSG